MSDSHDEWRELNAGFVLGVDGGQAGPMAFGITLHINGREFVLQSDPTRANALIEFARAVQWMAVGRKPRGLLPT